MRIVLELGVTSRATATYIEGYDVNFDIDEPSNRILMVPVVVGTEGMVPCAAFLTNETA